VFVFVIHVADAGDSVNGASQVLRQLTGAVCYLFSVSNIKLGVSFLCHIKHCSLSRFKINFTSMSGILNILLLAICVWNVKCRSASEMEQAIGK